MWSTEQSGDVFAIAQDLEGYLWLGTPTWPCPIRRHTLPAVGAEREQLRCRPTPLPRSRVHLKAAKADCLCRQRRRRSDRS